MLAPTIILLGKKMNLQYQMVKIIDKMAKGSACPSLSSLEAICSNKLSGLCSLFSKFCHSFILISPIHCQCIIIRVLKVLQTINRLLSSLSWLLSSKWNYNNLGES